MNTSFPQNYSPESERNIPPIETGKTPLPQAQPTVILGTARRMRADVMKGPVQEETATPAHFKKLAKQRLPLPTSMYNQPETPSKRLSVREIAAKYEKNQPKALKPGTTMRGTISKQTDDPKRVTAEDIFEKAVLRDEKAPVVEEEKKEEPQKLNNDEQLTSSTSTVGEELDTPSTSEEDTSNSSLETQEKPEDIQPRVFANRDSIGPTSRPVSRRGSVNDNVTVSLAPKTQVNIEDAKSKVATNFLTKAFQRLKASLESAEAKSLKEIEKNLPDAFKNEPNKEDLHNQILAATAIATKELKKGSSKEIKIPSLKDHTIVVIKSGKGKMDVLLKKDRKIGEGAFGVVFKAYSFRKQKDVVLKFPQKAEESEVKGEGMSAEEIESIKKQNKEEELALKKESELSLKNEEEILDLLGKHKGVQARVKIFSFNDGKETQTVTKNAFYSGGDFHKQVLSSKLLRLLNITSNELKAMDESTLKDTINQKTNTLKKFIEDKVKEKNTINSRTDLKLNAKKDLTRPIDTEIENEIDRFVKNASLVDLMDKDEGKKFTHEIADFQAKLRFNPNFDLDKNLPDLCSKINEGLLKAVKKSQSIDQVDLKKRMAYGNNILEGLLYIHSKGVIHGDIKPQNIFCNDTEAVLADFGGARQKGKKYSKAIPATKEYASPADLDAMLHFSKENQKNNEFRAGCANDFRETGITLYEMFTGGPTPDVKRDKDIYYKDLPYKNMKNDLITHLTADGVPEQDAERAAEIIAKMCKPHPFDPKFPPKEYPLPVKDKEIAELAKILERSASGA